MIDSLEEFSLFKECTKQELEEVSKICERITLKNGDRIFEAGSPAEYLFAVGEGSVELRSTVTHYQAAKEITLDRKFQGEIFGWSALTRPYIYTLSALTMQDSQLLKFEAKELKRLCEDNNHFGYILMKNVSEIIGERFATIESMLIDVIQQDLKEKEL